MMAHIKHTFYKNIFKNLCCIKDVNSILDITWWCPAVMGLSKDTGIKKVMSEPLQPNIL